MKEVVLLLGGESLLEDITLRKSCNALTTVSHVYPPTCWVIVYLRNSIMNELKVTLCSTKVPAANRVNVQVGLTTQSFSRELPFDVFYDGLRC